MRKIIALLTPLIWCAFFAIPAHAQIQLTALIDGSQEVPTTSTSGSGLGSFSVSADLSSVWYSITISNLTGNLTSAHIHRAAEGSNGPVVKTLLFDKGTATGVWSRNDSEPFTKELLAELLTGRLYVNVHSNRFPNGEIRGQIFLDADISFSIALDGTQEVPPITSPATGTGTLTLYYDLSAVVFDIALTGLPQPVTAAHFHRGARGENGPSILPLTVFGNIIVDFWSDLDSIPLTLDIVKDFIQGNIYLNVHTSANPNGEIRGQVQLEGGIGLQSLLSASQVAPNPPPSSGLGTGSLSLNGDFTELRYRITVDDLSGPITAAHIHRGDVQTNGPVVKTLQFSNGTAIGVWKKSDSEPFTEDLVHDLILGSLYVNVHTSSYPDGEIRGQIKLTTDIGFVATLDGSQEVPRVNSSGTGSASMLYIKGTGEFRYDLQTSGLSGDPTSAHIHRGARGVNGPVVKTLTLFPSGIGFGYWAKDDPEPLSRELVKELLRGNLYINAHTASFQNGEVRGQIARDWSSLTHVERISSAIPDAFTLGQNFPNPFNSSTAIPFALHQRSDVDLAVYSMLGERISTLVSAPFEAGSYSVKFATDHLPSGLYCYRLTTGDGLVLARTMTVLK